MCETPEIEIPTWLAASAIGCDKMWLVSDLPKSINSSAAPAYVGRVANKKIGHLRSEIALLQHGFADKSVSGLYDIC
jgi:hypothetical protein